MVSLATSGREWERNAQANPLWAVLTDRDRKNAEWDIGEFFATGRTECEAVMSRLRMLHAQPDPDGLFLDFGCGVGRLSRALMRYFAGGYGVDISPTMIEKAKRFAAGDRRKPLYLVNEREDLLDIPSGSIEFVYSHIVLQHVPRMLQPEFIAEFLRVLKHGGTAAFQIPTANLETATQRAAARVRRAVRNMLPPAVLGAARRMLGKDGQIAGVSMEMNVMPEDEVCALVACNGGTVLAAPFTNSTDTSHRGRIRFMDRDGALGAIRAGATDSKFLSQFFFVRRE